MKKVLLALSFALTGTVMAQFSSGTVNLPTSGTPIMTIKLETNPTTATLTLTGDSNSMLGIGFGNVGTGMENGADGFIYNSTANRDYTFAGFTAPNADVSQDWTEVSNTVSGTTRTVVATRSLSGGSGDFVIPNAAGDINIYYARRLGNQVIGYHGSDRDYATLNMAGTLGINDVSVDNKKVVLYPNPAKEMVSFKNADQIKSVDMYDSTGRKVRSAEVRGGNISLSDLKSGTYYFEILLKDGRLSYEKLIKE